MLSLDNTYNAEDLTDWDRRCHELAGTDDIEYCVEPKYDGAGISLIYDDGEPCPRCHPWRWGNGGRCNRQYQADKSHPALRSFYEALASGK